ncbi:MAG TPA: hypothetical protein VJ746_11255 [Nitrospira sp.]|nr:hypothetical protein [Nitrospira sp.]
MGRGAKEIGVKGLTRAGKNIVKPWPDAGYGGDPGALSEGELQLAFLLATIDLGLLIRSARQSILGVKRLPGLSTPAVV